jgi:flavin reductase (DIM6/NTAB) family NADH-FMN oxidoreductase RutF
MSTLSFHPTDLRRPRHQRSGSAERHTEDRDAPVASEHVWATPDARRFRTVMRRIVEPVVVVTGADDDGTPLGMTVSSLASVSLAPPLLLICVQTSSRTWGRMASQGAFAVNALGAGRQDLATRFAGPGDRFHGVALDTSPSGLPVLRDAIATLECVGHDGLRAGDHDVVIGRVVTTRYGDTAAPLAYHDGTYASVRPLAPSGAPT